MGWLESGTAIPLQFSKRKQIVRVFFDIVFFFIFVFQFRFRFVGNQNGEKIKINHRLKTVCENTKNIFWVFLEKWLVFKKTFQKQVPGTLHKYVLYVFLEIQ